jgi:hypothetical protein
MLYLRNNQFDVVGLVQSSTTEKLSPIQSVRPSSPSSPSSEVTLGFGPNLLVAYCYSTVLVQYRVVSDLSVRAC